MTTEQAINELKDWKTAFSHMAHIDKDMSYAIEAFNMAIEALQHGCEKVAESSDDYITIKRQFVLDAIDIGLSGYISDDDKLTLEGMGIAVSEMPSVQPEKSTTEEKSQLAEEKSTCDLISRRDAIEVAKKHWYKPDIAGALAELPSAQPERYIEIPETGIGDLSDGYHTFNGLYEQRMILFAALVKAYKEKAWKSYRHEDGEYCFGGGWFVVGIDTPEGSYTYHYENQYWDMFDCIDLPRAPHWDGHTETDAEVRLMSLKPERKKGEWVCFGMNKLCCLDCGEIAFERKNYCANCGRKMSKEVRHFKCMDCGKIFNELMDVCPNCGADMRTE